MDIIKDTDNNDFCEAQLQTSGSKRKYLLALAVFLTVMYLMIFVEHWFAAVGIANVDTCSIEKHELTHWLEGKGIVNGKEITAYLTPKGHMLQKGDEMYVKAAGSDRRSLPISRLSYDAEKNILTVYFDIDPQDYEEGAQVIVTKEQKTNRYTCIAAKAVHQDELDNYYVYVVQEKKSILGNELICKMKYIQVFLEDEVYAAVDLDDGSITGSDLIVLHSDREIADGDKIHCLDMEY